MTLTDCSCLQILNILLSFCYYSPFFRSHFPSSTFLSHRSDFNNNWMRGVRAGQRSYKKIMYLSQEISSTQEMKNIQDDCKQNPGLGRCRSCTHSACCLLGQWLRNIKKQRWSGSRYRRGPLQLLHLRPYFLYHYLSTDHILLAPASGVILFHSCHLRKKSSL